MKELKFKNGDTFPALGLGTWAAAKQGDIYRAVIEAVLAGYRHFDCAAIYGNQVEIGEALSAAISEGLVRREELWITSKLWSNGHGRENVLPHLSQTLKELHLDYLDLYLIHWPVAMVQDPTRGDYLPEPGVIPLADTWQGMKDVLKVGDVRHIGVSNFSKARLSELLAVGEIPEMNQIEVHPYLQQNDLIEFCHSHGIHITAFAPLGSGSRPDHLKKANEPILLEEPLVQEIAAKNGATPAQVLIAWSLSRGVSVIPKSANPKRLRQNLAAAELTLTGKELEQISGLEQGARYIDGSFWCGPNSPITSEYLWN
jgi:alcohol dehydrogenase (NADP+)